MALPGQFLFPPPGIVLSFNYLDTIDVSWESFQPNATDCYLTLYYAITTNNYIAYTPAYNQTVATRGSVPVKLNFAPTGYDGYFMFNYTLQDGSSGLFQSESIQVQHNALVSATTWSTYSYSTTSTTASSTTSMITTSSAATESLSSTSILTQTPSPSIAVAETQHSSLSTGAIAGISVSVSVGVVTVALVLIWFFISFRRRQRVSRQTPKLTDPKDAPEVVSNPTPGPMDPKELPGAEMVPAAEMSDPQELQAAETSGLIHELP